MNFILPAIAPVIRAGVMTANIIWKPAKSASGISSPLVLSEMLTLLKPRKSKPPITPPTSLPKESE